MYTLVIADDEAIECKALQLLIKKEFQDIDVIAIADNGIEFISLVEKHKPDIAIVDVNMPGINGIDAIDLLRVRGASTRFIINSAYDEFEYVQRAISLDIDAYILKPQKREATIDIIQKTCKSIDEMQFKEKNQRQIEELFINFQPVMENEIMFSIFINEASAYSFKTYCDIHGIEFYSGTIVSLVPLNLQSIRLHDINKSSLYDYMKTVLKTSCLFLSSITENSICLLIFSPAQIDGQLNAWLRDVLQVLLDQLYKHFSILFKAGVGHWYSDFDKMHDSYSQSLHALKLIGESGISFSPKNDRLLFDASDLSNRIVESVQKADIEALNRILAEAGMLLRTSKGLALQFWKQLCEKMNKTAIDTYDQRLLFRIVSTNLLQWLPESERSEALLSSRLGGETTLVSSIDEQDTNNYVLKALQYIEKNFKDDISLDTLSEKIGISPYYLSRLFKRELGQTFVEYITRIRMEKAVQLANDTRLTIREIAKLTGYSNDTYFCRVFKRFTGHTIGEFREKHRKKQF